MEKSVFLQQQIRNNTEDLQREFLDLKAWEEEMKRKDSEIAASMEENLPPIRKKKVKSVNKETPKEKNTTNEQKTKQKLSSFDYSSWDKFDVDKACEEIDKETSKEEVDEEMSPEHLEHLHSKAEELKVKGNNYVKKQEWKKAIDCYTEAIQIFSYDATFYANRALCYLKLNDLYSTEADCTVAIQLDERYVKAYHRRAFARMELKQYDEAKQDLEKVLKLEPSNKESKAMFLQVNEAIDSQKGVVITEESHDIEKKIGEKLVKKETKDLKGKAKNKAESEENDENDKQNKIKQDNNLPSWVPNLGNDYEMVKPVSKSPHERSQKPMKKVSVTEVNFGTSPLSKSVEQLEAEIKVKMQSKSAVDTQVQSNKKNDNKVLIEVISEESNEDLEIPPAPKTLVQFFADWSKTKSMNFRYKYLEQIKPESLPALFNDFLECETLNEILQVLNKEFMKRKRPVYQYLENLSNVKRFRAIILFLSSNDKKVVEQLLQYAKGNENKTDQDLEEIRKKYEI